MVSFYRTVAAVFVRVVRGGRRGIIIRRRKVAVVFHYRRGPTMELRTLSTFSAREVDSSYELTRCDGIDTKKLKLAPRERGRGREGGRERQTDRQGMGGETDRRGGGGGGDRDRGGGGERQRERDRERQTGRQAGRQADGGGGRGRQRQKERHRERQREREQDRMLLSLIKEGS